MSYQCLRTDGNGYGSRANAICKGLDMGLSDFMVEARIKTTFSTDNNFFISKRSTATWYGWDLRINANVLNLTIREVGGYAYLVGETVVNDGRWHTIIAVVDRSSATGMKLFIDGSEDTYSDQDNPSGVGNIDVNSVFEIGGVDGANYLYTGLIDEVRVWNFGYGGLPADYEAYITWRAAGRNVFLDIGQYNGGAWNVYADAYREEKVVDPGIENWDNNTPDDWTEDGESGGVRDITKESTEKHGGSFAVKLEATGNDETLFGLHQDLSLSPNKYYELKHWHYFSTRTAGYIRLGIFNPTDAYWVEFIQSSTDASYTEHLAVGKPTVVGSELWAYLRDETTTGIAYFDDISLKRVGLVAHYKFDGTYDDETTNANHLTAGGTGNVFPGYTLKKNKIISPFWIK